MGMCPKTMVKLRECGEHMGKLWDKHMGTYLKKNMGNSSLNGENNDKCELLEYLSQDYDVHGIIEINHQFCGWKPWPV